MAGSMLLLNNVPLQSSQTSNRSFGIYRQHLHSASSSESHFPQAIGKKIHLKQTPFAGLSVCSYSAKPVPLVNSEDAPFVSKNLKSVKEPVLLRKSKSFEQWDSLTAKFAGSANLLFLLLQLPQIILNTQNLMTGNKSALLAVPWLGMFTGLLGNLSLLSYFIKKGEREAVGVQMLGVISTYVVISQLAIAEAMPLPHFIGTSIVVATGLSLNFMKYFNMLTPKLWNLWEDFITIAGISALPQVMWSTFVPYVPNTILPGLVAFVAAVVSVFMARTGKLSEKGVKTLRSVSAWTASLLFMWMPVAQMWTNFLNPDNIKGLSAVTMLLAMIGNGLMIPRALFTRDLMWFTGAAWACVFYGWGNLTCMYCFKSISSGFFLASTIGFLACIGTTFWRDSKAYGHNSPITSLKELVFGVPKKPHYI